MFNVRVFKLKDLLKYFFKLAILIFVSVGIIKILSNIKKEEVNEEPKQGIVNIDCTGCIDETSTIVKEINKNKDNKLKAYKTNFFEDVVKSQIGSIEDYEIDVNQQENQVEEIQAIEEKIDEEETNNFSLESAESGLETEVITQNPIPLNYNYQYNNVKIKNDTSFELSDEIVEPNITVENKNIILFHTHTCESYTSNDKFPYTPTGTFRTTDLNFTVARVGDELENQLINYGYNVIHDKTYHDYPSYNGSYTNSLETVQNILKSDPTDIIIDIHRDAIGSRSDYAPSVKIGDGDVCAQIMFVIGTNEGGLWHPNWKQNLKFALKVQEKAEEMYPRII